MTLVGPRPQAFGTGTGPWGGMQVGGRNAIPNQNAETFFAGNTTAPFTSLEGGLITPEEFNANFAFEAQAMSVGLHLRRYRAGDAQLYRVQRGQQSE